MRVFIHVDATHDRAYWSWLSVIVEDHLKSGIHCLDQTNWSDLSESEWLSEQGDPYTRRRLDELTKLEMGDATGEGEDLDAAPKPLKHLDIKIQRETPQGSVHGAILGPVDAYKCLSAPLTIFVEDADSDGEFLVTIWKVGERKRLISAFEERRIEFAHCGGKDKIPVRFERWHRRRAPGPLRALVLRDSDKLWAKHDTKDPTADLEDMLPAGTHRHVLRKREIENYLPLAALRTEEAKLDPRDTKKLPRLRAQHDALQTLQKLSREASSHYDMKEGFRGIPNMKSINNRDNHIAIFTKLDFDTVILLWEGFGKKIGNLFETAREHITREALEEVCDFEEFEVIMDAIEALL
jgi:hypothetical protein